MKSFEEYNWDRMYIKTQDWIERNGIPGRVKTGCRAVYAGLPLVDIEIPCRGNKSIIARVRNYRNVYEDRGYTANGRRYCVFRIEFTENEEIANG
ncbi:hypothetical protein K040078D81_39790 [Blautia hominis]|uniref:Uncharacterized protein n=1 Tax=Blautia hominis TaxID=2025493 RepID=A0ABQ0BEH2_9FIRM